jgi:hypothetical protein
MILEGDESFSAAHFGVAVDEDGEYFPIDLLGQGISLRDNLECVPGVFLVECLNGSGLGQLRVAAHDVFLDHGFLSGGCHEMAGLFLFVFTIQQGVVPEPHHIPLRDFDLVTEDLPLTEIIASDLHAGVSLVPTKFESQHEITGFSPAPDQPVLSFR